MHYYFVFGIPRDGPLLVVASGRDTINVATSIKRLASDNVFLVQVKLCTLIFFIIPLIEAWKLMSLVHSTFIIIDCINAIIGDNC